MGDCSTTVRTPTWSGAAGEYSAVLAFSVPQGHPWQLLAERQREANRLVN